MGRELTRIGGGHATCLAMSSDVSATCLRARAAARALGTSTDELRVRALRAFAAALRDRADEVIAANRADVEEARAAGTSAALLDRLALDPDRVGAVARAVEDIGRQEDPLGRALSDSTRADGLRVRRIRVPIGVVAMIYE